MTKKELENHTTLDTDQCKWWVITLFSMAKSLACQTNNFDDAKEIQSAQDKIIKALEQPTSDDCVSRTQAIEWIENLRQMDECFGNYEDDYFPLSEVIDRLKNMPPVTPTRKIGRWIYNRDIDNWVCSECGETPKTLGYCGTSAFMTEHFKFCNHCGAEMVGAEMVGAEND